MCKRFSAIFVLFVLVCVCAFGVSSRYAYDTLTRNEQSLYNRIDAAILSCSEKIEFTGFSTDDFYRIFLDYLDDNPGVFWVKGKTRFSSKVDASGNVLSSTACFTYSHQDNLEFDKARFEELVGYFHQNVKDDPNDWVKLYHIYGYLASAITYDEEYLDQSMWSVFFNGIGVCAGFARSFQYLALQENIPCIIVSGYSRNTDGSRGECHAWCMARIAGTWFHFDPTWGIRDEKGNVDYTFFCRSQEKIERTHIIDTQFPIPEAADDSFSYARIRDRYLEKYSLEDVRRIINQASRNGESMVVIEFATGSELTKAVDDLFSQKKIFSIISSSSGSYSYDKDNCVLKYYLK